MKFTNNFILVALVAIALTSTVQVEAGGKKKNQSFRKIVKSNKNNLIVSKAEKLSNEKAQRIVDNLPKNGVKKSTYAFSDVAIAAAKKKKLNEALMARSRDISEGTEVQSIEAEKNIQTIDAAVTTNEQQINSEDAQNAVTEAEQQGAATEAQVATEAEQQRQATEAKSFDAIVSSSVDTTTTDETNAPGTIENLADNPTESVKDQGKITSNEESNLVSSSEISASNETNLQSNIASKSIINLDVASENPPSSNSEIAPPPANDEIVPPPADSGIAKPPTSSEVSPALTETNKDSPQPSNTSQSNDKKDEGWSMLAIISIVGAILVFLALSIVGYLHFSKSSEVESIDV